jgi:hypothetical protein
VKATAKRWHGRFWRVKFEDGFDLYPITTDELLGVMQHHDVTVRSNHPADGALVR